MAIWAAQCVAQLFRCSRSFWNETAHVGEFTLCG